MMMTETDFEALRRALQQTLAEPERIEQIRYKLAHEDEVEVAMFCSYHRQIDTLRLDASQDPPCEIDDPDAELRQPNFRGNHDAARLLKRMLKLGISRYEPDPMTAIEQATKRRTR